MGYIVQVVFIHIAYIHIESISYGISMQIFVTV